MLYMMQLNEPAQGMQKSSVGALTPTQRCNVQRINQDISEKFRISVIQNILYCLWFFRITASLKAHSANWSLPGGVQHRQTTCYAQLKSRNVCYVLVNIKNCAVDFQPSYISSHLHCNMYVALEYTYVVCCSRENIYCQCRTVALEKICAFCDFS